MPTSTQLHINQSCENIKNDVWLVWLILSSTHLSLLSQHIHLTPPPASLRASPSVSDSSLVCCQSSYMSEQAAVHSSWTLLCTQGIPSPVSSPPLALCFCLRCAVAPGWTVKSMSSPLLVTLRLPPVCAQVQWAVTYFAPCGAFFTFHTLPSICTATCLLILIFTDKRTLHAHRRLKNGFVTTGSPTCTNPPLKTGGFIVCWVSLD